MKLPRIAVAVESLNLPLRMGLQRANAMEADGVQLDIGRQLTVGDMTESARRQLLHELQQLRLGISALHVPLSKPLSELAGLDERLDSIKQTMPLSFPLKAGVVTFRMGRIPEDDSSQPYETLVAVLNELARHAGRVGAFPSVLPSGDTAEHVAQLLGKVTEGPLGVNLDPASVISAGQSPVVFFRTLVNCVNHITVRDAVRDLDGIVLEVPVGRGEVPWDEFLALVREADYRDWLTVARTQGDDRAVDVERAVRFVRTVLRD